MIRVVNNNLKNAMVSGGVGSQNLINMAANETETIEMERAAYGFFIVELVMERYTI